MTNANEHLLARRKDILDAAKKVFESAGYAATKMETVAQEAGIAKGSIYNYFKSKHDLFRTIFLEDLPDCQADVEELFDSNKSATDRLQLMLDLWYARLYERKRMGRLILEFWATAARGEQEDLATGFSKMYSHWRGRLAELIRQGVAAGEFRPHVNVEAAASLILAVVDGIWLQTLLDVQMVVDEEYVAALKRSIMKGLTAPEVAVNPIIAGVK